MNCALFLLRAEGGPFGPLLGSVCRKNLEKNLRSSFIKDSFCKNDEFCTFLAPGGGRPFWDSTNATTTTRYNSH